MAGAVGPPNMIAAASDRLRSACSLPNRMWTRSPAAGLTPSPAGLMRSPAGLGRSSAGLRRSGDGVIEKARRAEAGSRAAR